MNFNQNTFASQLDQYTGIAVDTKDDGSYNWDQWVATAGDLNTALGYDKGDFSYRTWYQEVTVMKDNIGMLVSCKIDFANGIGDDHIIMLTGWMTTTSGPEMVMAQASVQFHGDDDDNIMSVPLSSADGDLGTQIYNTLNAQIEDIDFGTGSTADGRATLPDIARANVNSMRNAAS